MIIDGYTADGFRTWSTDCVKHKPNVWVLFFNSLYYWATYNPFNAEISNPDGHQYQTDRSAETDAVRFKGIGNKYQNISQLYH